MAFNSSNKQIDQRKYRDTF